MVFYRLPVSINNNNNNPLSAGGHDVHKIVDRWTHNNPNVSLAPVWGINSSSSSLSLLLPSFSTPKKLKSTSLYVSDNNIVDYIISTETIFDLSILKKSQYNYILFPLTRMFRESDYIEPRLHSTYRNKAIPALQSYAQSAHLETEKVKSHLTANEHEVPITQDVIYDPHHPDADWSGFVSLKNNQKKHCSDHASKIVSLEFSDYGIVGKEDPKYSRNRAVENVSLSNAGLYQDTTSIIRGIDLPDDRDRWMSNSRRQMEFEPTSKTQLTFAKRLGTKKGIPDPAQSHSQSLNPFEIAVSRSSYSNTPRLQEFPVQHQKETPSTSLIGYRGPTSTKSLISDIASSVASRISEDMPRRALDQKHFDKGLIGENFKPVPGYTGRRNF